MGDYEMWNELKETLEHQYKTVEEFNEEESRLQASLLKKEWSAMETSILNLTAISQRIGELETVRNSIYQLIRKQYNLHEGISFNRGIAILPEELRNDLSTLHARLRSSVIITQAKLENIRKIASMKAGLVKDMLEVLLPEVRGKTYSPAGLGIHSQPSSILINKHL